jgi:hypothetical protein
VLVVLASDSRVPVKADNFGNVEHVSILL